MREILKLTFKLLTGKTLGVEMYKVNFEDLNQFLSYHEVFGKLHGDAASHTITALQAQQQSSGNATTTTTSSTNITTTTTSSIVTNDNTTTNAAADGLLLPKMETPSGGQQNIQNLPIDPNNPHTNQQLLAPDGTPITQATHVCDICGKMFPFRYQLIVHRRYHSERKPFNCQVK